MIDWVHVMCRSWGSHKRWLENGEHGWPPRSVSGRLIEEGPAAGSSTGSRPLPIKDDPEEYRLVSIALQRMAETHSMGMPCEIVRKHYVEKGSARDKAAELNISVPSYWQHLHAGHAFIAAVVPREAVPSIRVAS